jgi:hypothetical protein
VLHHERPCASRGKPADPGAVLKPILAKLEREGTTPRVGDFNRKKWQKRQYRVVRGTMKQDVAKTENLKAPYRATVTFEAEAFATQLFATKRC